MPSGSSGSSISSGGLKRPYSDFDAADESQDLFNIMRIEPDVDPKRDMEPPPMKKQRSPNENENIGLGRDLERIQFSANYLKQHHAIKQHVSLDESKKISRVKSNKIDKDKKNIGEYFRKQLQHNHIFLKRIPWITLNREDFINWPEKLPIKSLRNYTRTELTILLSNMEKIRFSEEFIGRNKAFMNSVTHDPNDKDIFSDIIKDSNDGLILEYFRNLLKQNQISYKRIQWDKLDPADFVNWPENLTIKSPNKYRKRELMLLLSQLENIRWSERFLRGKS